MVNDDQRNGDSAKGVQLRGARPSEGFQTKPSEPISEFSLFQRAAPLELMALSMPR